MFGGLWPGILNAVAYKKQPQAHLWNSRLQFSEGLGFENEVRSSILGLT